LITATLEQLGKYKDGSHRGKKKLEEVKKAETARIPAETRTKGGKNAKRQEGGSTSREVDVGDMESGGRYKWRYKKQGKLKREKEKSY